MRSHPRKTTTGSSGLLIAALSLSEYESAWRRKLDCSRKRKGMQVMAADPNDYDPLRLFEATSALSSFAGLAELLRSGRPITTRAVLSAMLNSGLIGLAIGLVWYHKFLGDGNVYFLVGVCVLAGLGGATFIDFAISSFTRWFGSKGPFGQGGDKPNGGSGAG